MNSKILFHPLLLFAIFFTNSAFSLTQMVPLTHSESELAEKLKFEYGVQTSVNCNATFDITSTSTGFNPAVWELISDKVTKKIVNKDFISGLIKLQERVGIKETKLDSITLQSRITIVGEGCEWKGHKIEWHLNIEENLPLASEINSPKYEFQCTADNGSKLYFFKSLLWINGSHFQIISRSEPNFETEPPVDEVRYQLEDGTVIAISFIDGQKSGIGYFFRANGSKSKALTCIRIPGLSSKVELT